MLFFNKFLYDIESFGEYHKIIDVPYKYNKYFWTSRINEIYQLMKNLYDGYIFSSYIDTRIYNPTLVMYLLKHIEQL